MSAQGFFVTGTDTGIGKTCFVVALMHGLTQTGFNVCGMKPVAAGSAFINGARVNADALAIQKACSQAITYDHINPFLYEEPIAPHIAAAGTNCPIKLETIVSAYNHLFFQHDIVLVEGAGGWRVPLDNTLSTVDLVRALNLSVILVVGLRVGCINHALLSAESLVRDGVGSVGWVGNQFTTDISHENEIMTTLKDRMPMPCLGYVAHSTTPDADKTLASECLSAFFQIKTVHKKATGCIKPAI